MIECQSTICVDDPQNHIHSDAAGWNSSAHGCIHPLPRLPAAQLLLQLHRLRAGFGPGHWHQLGFFLAALALSLRFCSLIHFHGLLIDPD